MASIVAKIRENRLKWLGYVLRRKFTVRPSFEGSVECLILLPYHPKNMLTIIL